MSTDLKKLIHNSSERLEMYEENHELYEGEAFEVFERNQFNYFKTYNPKNPKLSYINFNVFAIISNVFADMIWNEAPKITFKEKANQEWFDLWNEAVGFKAKMYEATSNASVMGESVLKLNIREVIPKTNQFNVVLDQIDNKIWFPIYDESNISKPVEYQCLLFEKTLEDKQTKVYLLEKYGYGEVIFESYKYVNGEYVQIDVMEYFSEEVDPKGKTKVGDTYVVQTNTFLPLVTQLVNISEPQDFHGYSDYTVDLKSLSSELNDALTSLSSIRRKHADPLLIVPDSAIKQAKMKVQGKKNNTDPTGFNAFGTSLTDPNANEVNHEVTQQVISDTKVMGMPADGSQVKPEYITWDASLESTFKEIEMIKKMIMQSSNLSPIVFDPDVSTGNLSGIAIQRMSITMINKAKRKMIYLRRAMQEIIFTAQQLAIKNNLGLTGTAEIPNIEFADGFPNDINELVVAHQGLLDAGLETPQDAMIEIFGYTKEQADEKAKEIQDNQVNFNTPILNQDNQVTS
jgi:hypothetical protein